MNGFRKSLGEAYLRKLVDGYGRKKFSNLLTPSVNCHLPQRGRLWFEPLLPYLFQSKRLKVFCHVKIRESLGYFGRNSYHNFLSCYKLFIIR